MRRIIKTRVIALGAALMTAGVLLAAQSNHDNQNRDNHKPSASQDMRQAGSHTKDAAKDAGRGAKQGTEKAYHHTRNGTEKAYNKTKNATKGAVNGGKEGAKKPD